MKVVVAVLLVVVVITIVIITIVIIIISKVEKKIIAFYKFCISFNYVLLLRVNVALQICEITRGDYLARKLYDHSA